jgi:hypothetical protein
MIRFAQFTAALAALLVVTWPVRAAAEEVVWINELESNPKLIGPEIVVEGRFQQRGVGTNLDQIRLKNSKVEFHLLPEADRKLPSNIRFIRLVGTLTRSDGTLKMRVKSWSKTTATDEDRYGDVAQRIGTTDSRAWYELADRTKRLAEFYGEDPLRALAREARVNGFRAEEAALRSSQPDELLALADRAADVGLDAEESRRMRHKALRWQFDRLKEGSAVASEWLKLSDRVAELLPGAKVPLSPADSEAVNKYRAKPIEAYDLTPRIRPMADRDLWIDAASRSLLIASEQSNADLAKLAADAKRLMPDRPEVGRELLRKWAESEAARISALPPASQVRRLADTFENELGDPQRAQEVLRLWLETRRKRLSAKDADGRVRLAKDYRSFPFLKDDDVAGKLLLEAIGIEVDLPEAVEALKSLGYVKGPNGWIRGNDPSLKGSPGTTNPPSDRLPKKDMTPKQVSDILGDPKPEDKIRYTNRDQNGNRVVIEQWTYRGPPDLHIIFRVSTPSDVRVIAINTQSQK